MACITDFFRRVSADEHAAASFKPRDRDPERCPKSVKRPVGRPRKRVLEDATTMENAAHLAYKECTGPLPSDDTPTADKSIQRQYTERQKKRVVRYARHLGVRPTERKFGIPRKNIQRWLKSCDFDRGLGTRGPKKQRVQRGRQKAGRHLSYPRELDDKLLEWVLCIRERHLAVSTQMLQDKALALIGEHNPSFKASEGWARKFIRRHSLVLRARTSIAQKLPSDL